MDSADCRSQWSSRGQQSGRLRRPGQVLPAPGHARQAQGVLGDGLRDRPQPVGDDDRLAAAEGREEAEGRGVVVADEVAGSG